MCELCQEHVEKEKYKGNFALLVVKLSYWCINISIEEKKGQKMISKDKNGVSNQRGTTWFF